MPAALVTRLVSLLGRVNAAHPWSHNDVYAPFVLHHARRVRRGGGTCAVDVGCGTGSLVRRLARVLPQVVGIEPDPRCADLARCSTATLPAVRVEATAFAGLAAGSADLVTFVASLHHLPLGPTLRSARAALRPDGRLVVVGCYRDEPADRWLSWLSLVLNPLVGLALHPRRAAVPPPRMTAPTREPTEPYSEVAAVLRQELPGVVVRRALFWRYLAVWQAPALAVGAAGVGERVPGG